MNESVRTTRFNSRIEAALKYLKIEREEFDKVLFEMGIDDPDIGLEILDAATTTFDDFYGALEKIHGEGTPLPVPRLKLAWAALQPPKEEPSKSTVTTDISALVNTLRPIGQWADLELLEAYSRECSAEIEEQLRKRTKGRFCIIFFDDGTVDAENSLYMLRKARYQETPSTFEIKGVIKQLYKVGEFPLEVFYECPIHPHVLLIDGYCEECGMTHDVKDTKRLALLRLITNMTSDPARTYRDLPFERLSKEFPKAFLEYRRLEEEDKQPSLKRRVSKNRDSDPFRTVQHRQF